MSLNFTYPTPLNGAVIIGDTTTNAFGGSADVPPQLTIAPNLAGANVPIAAVLELRSTDGAFVVPRMDTVERLALDPVVDGALVYDNNFLQYFVYQAGGWQAIAVGPFVETFTWNNDIVLDQTMAPNNGYFTDGAVLVTLTLPMVCGTGDRFIVYGDGAGFFKIAQNAGQQIRFNNALTTIGVGGSIESTAVGGCIEIVCRNASTDFKVTSSEGNFNVV